MSLILEALRKSESERQMGQPPGLMSQAAQSASRGERRAAPLWALLVVLVLAVGLGAWWLGKQNGNGSAAPTASEARSEPSPVVAEPTPPSAPVAAEPPPAAATAAPPGQMVVVDSRPAVAPPAAEPTSQPELKPESTPPDLIKPEPATATPSTPEAAAPVLPPDISLMPSAQRSALPPLKLSVHVFHQQPERRFAVIDGRRVLQGEALNNQISVQSIEREGVWLQIDGQSWWLPR